MPHRYRLEGARRPSVLSRLGFGLREALRDGYRRENLRQDVVAGLVVGIVALPLAMAFAIAAGVAPEHGLYTSIVAGAVIAALGGSRVSVSGPTAAFVVLLVPISHDHGAGGLLVASFLSGVILFLLGVARLGRLVQFIPHPVTTGFTTGIGVVIAGMQLRDFLGLRPDVWPRYFPEQMTALAHAASTFRWHEFAIGAFTLAVLLVWPRITRKLPAPLVALALSACVAWLLTRYVAGFTVDTIGSRFHFELDGVMHPGLSRSPPHLDWPWNYPGADGTPIGLSLDVVRSLIGPAFAIAALGAIVSLLCAVVADGIAGTKHDSDVELAAQGIGNMVAPFFGGFAAAGAMARTATGVRAGARSPIASLVHSAFVLAAVIALAPLLAYLPMAALAALLLVIAWNMSEVRHFLHIARVAPRSDVLVLLACFGLTVALDMVYAVTVGIVLAALLFLQRMTDLFQAEVAPGDHPRLADPGMQGVVVYKIAGPLFFGAAEKAVSALARVSGDTRAVILQMDDVPTMDITGLVALETAVKRLHASKIFVAIAGVQTQPMQVLRKAGIRSDPARIVVCANSDDAIEAVRAHFASSTAEAKSAT